MMGKASTRICIKPDYPKSDNLLPMSGFKSDRMIALREKAGLSQNRLASLLGVGQSTINRLESGDTQSPRFILKLARALGTTPEYLSGESDDPASIDNSRGGLVRHASREADPDLVELAEIDLRYGLGGTYLDGPVIENRRAFSRSLLRHFTSAAPENLFWASGDGDSMEPTIRSGELILIDRSQVSPRLGDGIWAFAWGDVGMIKRLRPLPDGSVEIHSDNPLVRPAIAADGEIHVVGRVVAVVRKM